MENYIENLHVKGFRLFEELNVKFNRRFNFIVGPNGCGKTSLLRALASAYSHTNFCDSRLKDNFEVWSDVVLNNEKRRFGAKHRKGKVLEKHYRSNPRLDWEYPPKELDVNKVELSLNNKEYCPLFLGAYRRIEYKQISGMVREENYQDSRRKYLQESSLNLSGGKLPDVKQWMINRYFQIEKEWAKIEKENWDWLITNFNEITPKDWDFSFSKIQRDLEPMFILNGNECYLEELSGGFQSILSTVFAIFEWIEKTNESNNISVKDAKGTVVIDELDAHIHPEWQLMIKKTLCKMFPKLQFIITTHSPHIVSSAEAGEVIIMNKDSRNATLEPSSKSYSGWSTDNILEDIMAVNNLENKKYNLLINRALDSVESKNSTKLLENIVELKEVSHPNDPIVMSLEIKLAGLKLGDA